MFKSLALILHLVVGATLMGVAITAALVAGVGTPGVLLGAALGGLVAALPLSWWLARQLTRTAAPPQT